MDISYLDLCFPDNLGLFVPSSVKLNTTLVFHMRHLYSCSESEVLCLCIYMSRYAWALSRGKVTASAVSLLVN